MSTSQFDATPLLDEYGDVALVRELTQLFIENAKSGMADILAAIASSSGAALKQAAHKLRGSLLTFNAEPAVALARELELMGERGVLDGSEGVAADLAAHIDDLCVGATSWLAEHAS